MTYFQHIRHAQWKTKVTSLNQPMQEFADLCVSNLRWGLDSVQLCKPDTYMHVLLFAGASIT